MFNLLKNKFQFKDRTYAANILAAALQDFLRKEIQRENKNYNNNNLLLLVLGIARGGVVVANIVATKLKASNFDIVIAKKLRTPDNKEVGFGAIADDGTVYVDDRIVKDLSISEQYIEKDKDIQLLEVERRSALLGEKELQQQLKDKNCNDNTVTILVDDGAGTGATVMAEVRSIRKTLLSSTNKLIIGLPVAPKQVVELLRHEGVDHVEVVTAPSHDTFCSVAQYYQRYEDVNDDKVIEIMKDRKILP